MGQPIMKTGLTKRVRIIPRGLVGRKLIRCPRCAELLMDVDRNEKVELYRLPTRKRVNYEETKQCAACGSMIGYNLMKSSETT